MSERSYAMDHELKRRLGAMEQLDQEIERLDGALSVLSERLGPITTQYNSEADHENVPHPEPSTLLLGRIERLSATTSRLEAMTANIDL